MRVLSSRASRESEFHGSFGQCSVLSLAMPQSLIASTPFEDFGKTSISSDLLSFCSNLQCLGVLCSFCPPASWLAVLVCLGHRASFLSAVLCLLFPFVFLLSNCCSYNSVSGVTIPTPPLCFLCHLFSEPLLSLSLNTKSRNVTQ